MTPKRQTRTRLAARWCEELGRAGFLKLCVSDGESRPDVRSLAICREILARHHGLADFAFAMQGLGSGAISLVRHHRAEARMASARRERRGDCRLRHDRAGVRIGRGEHGDVGDARRQRMGAGRREDLHLQWRHRGFLRDLRAHRRRRGLARAVGLHRSGDAGAGRGADRRHRRRIRSRGSNTTTSASPPMPSSASRAKAFASAWRR